MSFLKKLIRKKEEKAPVTIEVKKTELEELCDDEKEVYDALCNTMYLDPRKIGTSMKEAEEKAKEAKKSGDLVRAKTWYRIAGGLAIHEGKVKKVVYCFTQCQKLSPNENYPILKIPEKAIAKAQEYYKQYLK